MQLLRDNLTLWTSDMTEGGVTLSLTRFHHADLSPSGNQGEDAPKKEGEETKAAEEPVAAAA